MSEEKRSGSKARIAVVGAGLIGQRHVKHVAAHAGLVAIVDPSPAAKEVASTYQVPLMELDELLQSEKPDGVVIATPNQLHEQQALKCIAAGVAVLIEKPITSDVAAAQKIVDAAEKAIVPVLVGHHRRYNPRIKLARKIIDDGHIGDLVAAHTSCWLYKPDDYFDVSWRREPGAGPVFINLIHDVDLLRFFCGDVTSVQAMESNKVRGNAVEDTCVILLKFASGALGTVTVSDTIAAPWSWELTAGENAAYSNTHTVSSMIGGTRGSLSIPDLGLWQHEAEPSWWTPIYRKELEAADDDPLVLQIQHFARVALRQEEPFMSGREGMETLRVIEAIKQASATGETVNL